LPSRRAVPSSRLDIRANDTKTGSQKQEESTWGSVLISFLQSLVFLAAILFLAVVSPVGEELGRSVGRIEPKTEAQTVSFVKNVFVPYSAVDVHSGFPAYKRLLCAIGKVFERGERESSFLVATDSDIGNSIGSGSVWGTVGEFFGKRSYYVSNSRIEGWSMPIIPKENSHGLFAAEIARSVLIAIREKIRAKVGVGSLSVNRGLMDTLARHDKAEERNQASQDYHCYAANLFLFEAFDRFPHILILLGCVVCFISGAVLLFATIISFAVGLWNSLWKILLQFCIAYALVGAGLSLLHLLL
jgi:hypothetical protein